MMVLLKLKMLRECFTLLKKRNAHRVSCVCQDNLGLSPLLLLKTQMGELQHGHGKTYCSPFRSSCEVVLFCPFFFPYCHFPFSHCFLWLGHTHKVQLLAGS